MSQDPEQLLVALREAGREAAAAKAMHEYLEHYRRHLIARLMQDAEGRGVKSAAAQEREALASATYLDHLEAMKEAHVKAAVAGTRRLEAELAIELWRTKRADERLERRAYS